MFSATSGGKASPKAGFGWVAGVFAWLVLQAAKSKPADTKTIIHFAAFLEPVEQQAKDDEQEKPTIPATISPLRLYAYQSA
jgi:hypothetical protein